MIVDGSLIVFVELSKIDIVFVIVFGGEIQKYPGRGC